MIRLNSLLCSIFLTIFLIGCSGAEEPNVDVSARPAKLLKVQASSNQKDFSFPAIIRAAQTAELTFQVNGQLIELNVLEGQRVKKGDIIASLDQRDAQNYLAQRQAEFNNAQTELKRAERLSAADAISKSVLDTRRTQRDITKAALNTAKKAFSDTVIRAPFDGGIATVTANQYQNIQAKEIVAILQSTEVEAVIDVPGTIIARIPQLVPLGTRVVLDDALNLELPAIFKEATGIADQSSQTYKISFSFEPPTDLFILPGMTATVKSTFLNETIDDGTLGVSVPLTAIFTEGNNSYVWLITPNTMRVAKRQVVIGADIGSNITIISGLKSGETIIIAGVSFFQEGLIVRSWELR